MAPSAGKMLEIRLTKPGTVRIIPETDRHTGHWRSQHQLAHLIPYWIATVVPGFDRRAQTPTLELSRIHRKPGMRKNESSADVRTAAHRAEPDAGLDLLVDPLETIARQRRAGRPDRPQRFEAELLSRLELSFLTRHQERCAGTEIVD